MRSWFCDFENRQIMKNILLLTSILFLLFSCNKKEETKLVQKPEKEFIEDSLIYEVVNAVLEMPEIKKDSAKYMLNLASLDLIDLHTIEEEFYRDAEKYFGEIDTITIKNQIKKSRYSYYQKEKINNIELIDYDLTNIKTDEQLDSLKKSIIKYTPNISISLPIFNKEKNAALLSYSYFPHYGKYIIVSKHNGKWILSKTFGVIQF